ncbi:MAG: peptide deformylase [Eubacterium sp.]|jgi:peptide deformylase|nr:peptide deformylase [Eubacterium sp.]MCH4078640.1 peptide deformylase [Eubacterium sp.]MCH4109781.1 peptide deformylase [Eubacterium sp.]MCI1306989.1 peptide deformylase [Eubacterium sp.]MCI1428115.1 peptide deformylase [Eubacterium sp.]
MALRNVVKQGDPILSKKCREVPQVNEHYQTILTDMLETMRQSEGVGIAGPQVGILRRMFVAEPEPGRVYYMINPEITEMSGEQECTEGCLSVPGYFGTVKRPEKIHIKALDFAGNPVEYDFEGFDADVMCHEYDHLDGIMFTDKAEEIHTVEEEAERREEEEQDQ